MTDIEQWEKEKNLFMEMIGETKSMAAKSITKKDEE